MGFNKYGKKITLVVAITVLVASIIKDKNIDNK